MTGAAELSHAQIPAKLKKNNLPVMSRAVKLSQS
jgi:hypothetical protein